MFIGVTQRKVIDVRAEPNASPPIAEAAHQEIDQVFIETSAEQVAENLAVGRGIDYYAISFTGTLLDVKNVNPVTLKGGKRAAAPKREVFKIQAGGEDVGSGIAEV